MDANIKTLLVAAQAAMAQAYAPYSGLCVGACLQSADGQLFGGANIENAAFPLTLCAEASALATLITSGQREITAVLITSSSTQPCPPCGACRQRLSEFAAPETPIHLYSATGNYAMYSLNDLLPHRFTHSLLA